MISVYDYPIQLSFIKIPDMMMLTLGRSVLELPTLISNGHWSDLTSPLMEGQEEQRIPFNPRPAGVFSRTRPTGGHILPPPPHCLTPELIGAARRARPSKALNEKIPMRIKYFILEVTCKVKVRSKVRNMCFRIIADDCP